MSDVTLIMRKQSNTNTYLRDILQNNWHELFKNFIVVNKKAGDGTRLKQTRDMTIKCDLRSLIETWIKNFKEQNWDNWEEL